ncbi:hypothetical protein KIN20_034705 [Parelaphostrongylus tenuis]|uniref:Activin types I and II receptor domain-containing protein n=1 Tax=Parelaphostrongylus tenuis TaxID=148309 RepID=A0AAD5WJ68_PARTN|nr:hypothetical protein KIN20_034705 [Parelaphostrongylus tenuis]
MKVLTLLFLLGTISCCAALQCYAKHSAGQDNDTSKIITCLRPTDYCYNATTTTTTTTNNSQSKEVSIAGCSTTRCLMSQHKCINYTHHGNEITFCCCNSGDLCNSKDSYLTFYEKIKQWIKNIG